MSIDPSDPTLFLQPVQAALLKLAFKNRGSLAPMQLKTIARQLIGMLLAGAAPAAEQLQPLWDRGLHIHSLTAALTCLYQELNRAGQPARAQTLLDWAPALIDTYNALELAAVRREQEGLRRAFNEALNAERAESDRLGVLLQEVSTPVMPVYDGILVLPLIGSIDSGRSSQLTERLLGDITRLRAHSVIIDITGVPVVDTAVAQHLLQTAQAARLLGASVILVGVSPEVAQTMVQLGVDVGDLRTLSNLQAGIAHALGRRGLHIG